MYPVRGDAANVRLAHLRAWDSALITAAPQGDAARLPILLDKAIERIEPASHAAGQTIAERIAQLPEGERERWAGLIEVVVKDLE